MNVLVDYIIQIPGRTGPVIDWMIGFHGKVAAESLLHIAQPLILQVSGHTDIVPLP